MTFFYIFCDRNVYLQYKAVCVKVYVGGGFVLNFNQNRAYVENEFEMANFDKSTGLSKEELAVRLKEFQQTEYDLPRQIVFANIFSFVLENAELEINEHTPFAVKMNLGVNYSRFANPDAFEMEIFREQRKKILQEKFPEDYRKMLDDHVSFGTYTDFWHTIPNWDEILSSGFAGILEKAEKSKQSLVSQGKCDENQLAFFDSVIICYRAILRWLDRIYDYSLKFNTPQFSQAVKKLSSEPPKTLYEVLLMSVLYLYVAEIGCVKGRSLGDIDRLYLPYYENDLKNGVSQEELTELIKFFFIHFTATKRFAEQPFTIGGCDKDGNDRSNVLTLKLLEIYDEMDIYDPKIHIRYHKNINREVLIKAVSMIRKGHNSICFINDDAVFAGYERFGISKEESQKYVVLGCYEPIIMGLENGEIGAAWINMVKFVEFAINNGRDIATNRLSGFECNSDVDSFDEFFTIFTTQFKHYIDLTLDFVQRQEKFNTLINPSPIYSATFPECIEKGRDVHEFALKYNNMGLKFFGMATVVDSLAVIKKFVYDNKEITLGELRNALKADWQGYEELRERIIKDKDKYGNNLPLPDEILTRITSFVEKEIFGTNLNRGGKLRLGLDSIDICVLLGRVTSATPDGRHNGDSVSKNLNAYEGMDRCGITSYLQTVLKIDSSVFFNGAPCDFIVHPSAVEGEKGLKDFVSLVEIFFAKGGFALQGNVYDSKILKQAQENPEKYKTLQVRVCGWNEYFVKLNKPLQDKFIKQCEVLD